MFDILEGAIGNHHSALLEVVSLDFECSIGIVGLCPVPKKSSFEMRVHTNVIQ